MHTSLRADPLRLGPGVRVKCITPLARPGSGWALRYARNKSCKSCATFLGCGVPGFCISGGVNVAHNPTVAAVLHSRRRGMSHQLAAFFCCFGFIGCQKYRTP